MLQQISNEKFRYQSADFQVELCQENKCQQSTWS